jgi:prepilin peptidase CpaA
MVGSAVVLAGIGILAIIAWGDARTRRIPNWLSIAVASLGLMRILMAGDPAAAGYTVAAATATFVATFLLFWRGAIGGGDAKLIPAVVLLIGYRELLGFLFLMSLFGGVLAAATLIRSKLPARLSLIGWREPTPLRDSNAASVPARQILTVPYGVAVAAAGAMTLIMAR